jgi:hypothetical protein
VDAWDQEPSRRPVLSSDGGPVIYYWRPEIEAVLGASHQPDLTAKEALEALEDLSVSFNGDSIDDDLSQGVIKVFSSIVRLGHIPIRRHEDTLLRSIYDCANVERYPADYDSPYFKIFLLLQAHFSRLPLSPELATDLAIVLKRVFSIFSVCAPHDWSNSDMSFVARWLQVFPLMHMCVHGMWNHNHQLKQIPHFEDDVSCSIKRQGLLLIHASGCQTFPCGRHLLRARRREHGCTSTQRPPMDGRSEDVRQHAT